MRIISIVIYYMFNQDIVLDMDCLFSNGYDMAAITSTHMYIQYTLLASSDCLRIRNILNTADG